MTEDEFAGSIAALTGRMAMLEVLNANMLAYLCLQFDQPIPLAAHILNEVERKLVAAQKAAPKPERQVADTALASYRELSAAMLSMIARIAEPGGTG